MTALALNILVSVISVCSVAYGNAHDWEKLNDYSSQLYNSLPLSAEGHSKLQANGNIGKALDEALPIAEQHGLSKKIGLRLLHRHECVNAGEIMLERFGEWDSKPAFITFIEDGAGVKTLYPASWISTASGTRVFEFSDDPAVREVCATIEGSGIYDKIVGVLKKHRLNDILGVSVTERSTLDRFTKGQPFYELIRPAPYASVLINKPWDEIRGAEGMLVRTTWVIGNPAHDVECVTYCHTSDGDYNWHQITHG